MNEEGKFQIIVSSDLDYEKMVVFLEYGKSLIAILDCEKGVDQSVIQIIPNNEILKFKYSEFVHYLNKAFEKLKEVNK